MTRTVEISATGDYTLFSTWDATESSNVANDGQPHVANVFNVMAIDPLSMASWVSTRSATNSITIQGDPGSLGDASARPIWKTQTRFGYALKTPQDHFVHVIGINFIRDVEDGGIVDMQRSGTTTAQGTSLTDCIIIDKSGTGTQSRALVNRAIVDNCLVIADSSGTGAGIWSGNSSGTLFRQCTLIGCGISCGTAGSQDSAPKVIDCVAVDASSDDFTAGSYFANISEGNASSDATAPGTSPQINVVPATVFTDYTGDDTGDYTPVVGEALEGTGATPPPITNDITGTAHNDPADIGAYAASAGPTADTNTFTITIDSGVPTVDVLVGGAWVKHTPYVKQGGVWVQATPYVKSGGSWEETE